MPLYEYHCSKCDKSFESHSSKPLKQEADDGADCPECGELADRVSISRTGKPVLIGSGFHVNDYPKNRI